MTVGIIQSNYIPWKGYFDFIDDVDLFVFHDDLQYTKGDWRNRNKIKTISSTTWLTVPVKYRSTIQLIAETEIDYSQRWQQKHLNQIKENYHRAPFFGRIFNEFSQILLDKYETISNLNLSLIKWIMNKLNIKTPVILASELKPIGSKTERLIDILTKLNASAYLSGPSAENYLDYTLFENSGIGLAYKTYNYKEYTQQFQPFDGTVTVLDLMFNKGFDVREYFKSINCNTKILDSKKLKITN
ncbi:MAG: WbqC family protein [Ignavibacteriaceae bacterium]|jgi:hypothetical protein